MSKKATGIVRKIDPLGRITLPKELRDVYGLHVGARMELYVEGEEIVLKMYNPNCIFCGSLKNTVVYKDKMLCTTCLEELANFMLYMEKR